MSMLGFARRALILLLLTFASSSLAAGELQPQETAASTRWVAVVENANIVYFVYANPARIERYNLAAAAWMSDIQLGATPTAFTVDPQHLFISFARRTSRFALDGSGEVHLKNTPDDVRTLFVVGEYLYIGTYSSFWSIDKLTGSEVDFEDYYYSVQGVDVAPGLRKAFGRSTDVGPSDIVAMSLNADGTFAEQRDSPYHGDYPDATQTYVFPGEARVADDTGIVYNTNDLTYSNSLGGRFDDLTFYGNLPIVLRNGEIIGYSNAFLETGRYRPDNAPFKIFVHNNRIFSFYQGADEIEAEQLSLDLLKPAEPGEPVDPNGLAYEPDAVALGKDDVVYLLSRANLSIFRWSTLLRRYLETIPLVEAPAFMAYSAKTHRLYLTYPSGAIRQIRLGESTRETPFVNSPQAPHGLATAGEYVFVSDPSGAWTTHYVYAPDGSLVAQRDWNYRSLEFVWSELNRRMYFFRDDTSPNDLHWEEIKTDGTLGLEGESPYHGEIDTTHPIRVSPDASTIVLGSGEIFDAGTLERTDSLSNDVADAAWLQGTLFTIRPVAGGTELQKWGPNYGIAGQVGIPGAPLRLFARNTHLLAITSAAGIPRFSFWTSTLNEFINSTPLNLADGRFTIQAIWRLPNGSSGEGHPVQITRDTGYFWFFSPDNVEMIVKVLDGCFVNHRIWVFAGGLTNVEVVFTVIDNQTGEVRTYLNPQGQSFRPLQDTSALAGCPAAGLAPGPESLLDLPNDLITRQIQPSDAGLRLNGDRFNVEIAWQTADGQSGTGQLVQLTNDTGYFWFFGASNAEVVVKVLNGCGVNGQYWVFAGGLTNVRTELRVTDTVTGEIRSYVNPQGQPFLPLQDTSAFRCP